MFKLLKSYLYGYKTTKKIILFESDDWGALRMPNKKVFDNLINKNIDVYSNPFNKYDCLENNEDLDLLNNLLLKIYNNSGKKIKLTLNFIVGNPDFEMIRKFNFESYFYETFNETYKKTIKSNEVLNKITFGIVNGYFKPQYHGREHVNVMRWLNELRNNNSDLLEAFNQNTFAITLNKKENLNLWEAYNYIGDNELFFVNDAICEGIQIFKDIFQYNSLSTIAPVGVWDKNIEDTFKKQNIQIIQSFLNQKIPLETHYLNKYHYTGEINKNRQKYTVRNCYFEPATNPNINWVENCISQIERSFKFYNPAIISTHRINFVGGISEKLRNDNLLKFEQLINLIIKKWPDIEFMFTDEFVEKQLTN